MSEYTDIVVRASATSVARSEDFIAAARRVVEVNRALDKASGESAYAYDMVKHYEPRFTEIDREHADLKEKMEEWRTKAHDAEVLWDSLLSHRETAIERLTRAQKKLDKVLTAEARSDADIPVTPMIERDELRDFPKLIGPPKLTRPQYEVGKAAEADPEKMARARALFEAHVYVPADEVARVLCVSRGSIYNIAKRNGWIRQR